MRDSFRITKDFTLGEWCVSRERPDLVEGVPDQLGPNVVKHTFTILQPLRELYGRLWILSGYRTPRLNDAIGGSATSQHLQGEAADIVLATGKAASFQIFRDLLLATNALPAGQVIWYEERSFLHIALPSTRYPEPSYHLHWPARQLRYHPIRTIAALDLLLVI